MFQKLVSHNDDLRRLVEKGYAVTFDTGHLVIRDIPYLGQDGSLRKGAIATVLSFINQEKVAQVDHQIFFAGGVPYGLDGMPLPNLAGGEVRVPLTDACSDVVVERSFSNKPTSTGKFEDFFAKIESYVSIISGPAMDRHGASPYTFRTVDCANPNSVFKFQDTLTSRAEIADLAGVFKDDVIAIIGLGGTGAYVLDFLVKTPVKEIRAFDLDEFHVHNAFRSPGRLVPDELGTKKVAVYQSRYENFRHGLVLVPKFVDADSSEDLAGVTFAFVCVDKGPARAAVFDLLIRLRIPFIDVGMGLSRKRGGLGGMMRTTYFSVDSAAEVRQKGLAEENDAPDNLYKANIQISELNAMNACFAVIKFKQLRGFYASEPNYHLLFDVSDLKVVTESLEDES